MNQSVLNIIFDPELFQISVSHNFFFFWDIKIVYKRKNSSLSKRKSNLHIIQIEGCSDQMVYYDPWLEK